MVVAGRANNLNLLLSTHKVSLSTREETSQPCVGSGEVEFVVKRLTLVRVASGLIFGVVHREGTQWVSLFYFHRPNKVNLN